MALTCPFTVKCVRVFATLYDVRLHNGNTQIMQQTHMHKAETGCVEAKKLLPHLRQSEGNQTMINNLVPSRAVSIFFSLSLN